jgi:hypothetical protein
MLAGPVASHFGLVALHLSNPFKKICRLNLHQARDAVWNIGISADSGIAVALARANFK